jgi:formylmethanofuran dehydrogenase subunit C
MLIKFINSNTNTSQLSGGGTVQTGDIIVDVDVPIVISAYANAGGFSVIDLAIQDPAGGALTTLEVQTDGDAGATLPQSFIDDLNGAVEAGVADPYHIPNVSELTVPGAYLHAGVEYAITGLEIS